MKGKRHSSVEAFQTCKLGMEPPDADWAKKNQRWGQ